MRCYFIRHGKTAGNEVKRYIGRTDEALSENGKKELLQKKEAGCYPKVDIVIHSGMKRAVETAELIYGSDMLQLEIPALRECDFGIFEGKNYQELSGNELYQQWIDSNGTLPFPNGESVEDFQRRCVESFFACVKEYRQYESVAFCVHGGTIMAILSEFAEDAACNQKSGLGKTYYDYHCDNGDCLSYEVDYTEKQKLILKIKTEK